MIVSEVILCLNTCLQSFQARLVIDYINEASSEGLTWRGIWLIAFQCAIVIFERIGNSHKDRCRIIAGVRARNLVKAVLYKKMTTVSHATNKDFGEGQIMGLISKDADKADDLFKIISLGINMFIITLITFCYLSYNFGSSFVIVMLITSAMYLLNQ